MTESLTTSPVVSDPARLTAVLCGSYRRDRSGLQRAFDALSKYFSVLSPTSLDFVDPGAEFVRLSDELEDSVHDVERRHLDAVSSADFVWLHAPSGYVGASAALEIGHANAVGVPVYSSEAPGDQTLAAFVTVVASPASVSTSLDPKCGTGIRRLQSYYRRAAARRGWDEESPRDTLLLLTEELGEVARAIRKHEGLSRDGEWNDGPVGHELADLQLYLVHLANGLGIDLADAVTAKERINSARAADRSVA
jgi:NTP pyrophosphatase (non-canonical NTP hydrolase)